MTAATGVRTTRRTQGWRSGEKFRITPTRADLLDAAFAVGLCGLGVLGFRTTYGGSAYLVAGVLAACFGVALAYLANRLGQPVLALAAVTVVVFFLFGGAVALRATAAGGVLPTVATLHDLSSTSIFGWKDLLTTLPPVGSSSHLLALPYVVGLLGGVTAMCIAGRSRRAAAPLLAPAAVLAVGILFGTSKPADLFLQGAVFGVVALAWVALRHQRRRPTIGGHGRLNRLVGGVALLACAGACAQTVSSYLPFANMQHRVVLRSYVQPPFDPGAYPSPLAGFRQYVEPATARRPKSLRDTVLFSIAGLSKGSDVRIATMDAYDGLVWGFDTGANTDSSTSDAFQRVGSSIPPVAQGSHVTATVTVGAYGDVWLPDAGYLTGLSFAGRDSAALASAFRYNLDSGTAVVPSGLRSGDSYSFTTLLPVMPSASTLAGASPAGAVLPVTGVAPEVAIDAKRWSVNATGTYAKLQAIASYLKTNGEYSDGDSGGGSNSPEVLPGHSAGRIASFLNDTHLVGDGEQYAATMALMANALGDPARVVFGAVPEAGGTVKGKDIAAWAEVDFAGIGWVPFDATPPISHKPQPQPPKPQQATSNSQVVPPPPIIAPPPIGNPSQTSSAGKQNAAHKAAPKGGGITVPGWAITSAKYGGPSLSLLLLLLTAVLVLKIRRRRRRRKRGPTTSRIAGGWYEIVDLARDLGTAVPAGWTRREQARLLGDVELTRLAIDADASIFGPGMPIDADVVRYWTQVEDGLRRLRSTVSFWHRFRATISWRSLRRPPVVGGLPGDNLVPTSGLLSGAAEAPSDGRRSLALIDQLARRPGRQEPGAHS